MLHPNTHGGAPARPLPLPMLYCAALSQREAFTHMFGVPFLFLRLVPQFLSGQPRGYPSSIWLWWLIMAGSHL